MKRGHAFGKFKKTNCLKLTRSPQKGPTASSEEGPTASPQEGPTRRLQEWPMVSYLEGPAIVEQIKSA